MEWYLIVAITVVGTTLFNAIGILVFLRYALPVLLPYFFKRYAFHQARTKLHAESESNGNGSTEQGQIW